MITYHHEPTRTSVETESGNVGSDTSYVKMQLRTEYVDTSITRYDSDTVGVWTAQSIHLQASNDVDAEVVDRPGCDRYLVVRLGFQDNIFVPIKIAEAIAEALASEAVAS